MPPLQLFFDPTHGYVCSCCFRAVDPKRPPTPAYFRDHLEKCRDATEGWTFDGEFASAELQRVRTVAEQFARCIAACSSDAERVQLYQLYLKADPLPRVLWCTHPSCNRGFKYWNGHDPATRNEHRVNNRIEVVAYCSLLVEKNPRMYIREMDLEFQTLKAAFILASEKVPGKAQRSFSQWTRCVGSPQSAPPEFSSRPSPVDC